jgi:hypothetical protein
MSKNVAYRKFTRNKIDAMVKIVSDKLNLEIKVEWRKSENGKRWLCRLVFYNRVYRITSRSWDNLVYCTLFMTTRQAAAVIHVIPGMVDLLSSLGKGKSFQYDRPTQRTITRAANTSVGLLV